MTDELSSSLVPCSSLPIEPSSDAIHKRRQRLAQDVADQIMNSTTKEEYTRIIKLTVKYLGLSKEINISCNPPGTRLTSFDKRIIVWQFWHEKSSPSTNTSRPARLRVDQKKLLHQDLPFVDTCRVVKVRKRDYYENHWLLVDKVLLLLYSMYLKLEIEKPVSLGVFHGLRPFYIRMPTTQDLEMCCCKTHLHAKWVIEAIIANIRKQREIELQRRQNEKEENLKNGITLDKVYEDFWEVPFTDFRSFYAFLSEECEHGERTYVNWECTENKKHLCCHASSKWKVIKEKLLDEDDQITTTPLHHFEKVDTTNKQNIIVKRLRQITTQASMNFLVDFTEKMIPKVIHHRNHLRYYRNTIHAFQKHFSGIFIDIDFSQNLEVPVKFEPQSLHWTHEQVTVHSAIMKTSWNDSKEYHPYISKCLKHDQQFVEVTMGMIVNDAKLLPNDHIVIESDNCSSQYKSSNHFESIQRLSNKLMVTIIRVFGVPEHGKGEVDHVGGLAKTTIRHAIASGGHFADAASMVQYLAGHFEDKGNLQYVVREVLPEDLEEARKRASKKGFVTIDGSSLFQVMVFTPNEKCIKAAPRLCLCDQCRIKYGSCSLFTEYELSVQTKKISVLRSEQLEEGDVVQCNDVTYEYLQVGSICAVAAAKKSSEIVWFIKIHTDEEAVSDITDSYGNTIKGGNRYFAGHFLEYRGPCRGGEKYEQMDETTFFFKESVVYPFAQFKEDKGFCVISKEDYCDILTYVDQNGMAAI